jgi:AraC-like DNA-binding protein
LEADQQDSVSNMVSSPMGLLVATKLLEIAPHNIQVPRLCRADEAFFERINDYIDANARGDITAEGLAKLCCVSSRTLYDRFKKVKGVAPNAYVRERKLLKVRSRMLNFHSGVQNVTEVALEYGFSHLGRFSSEYKQLFGESPSETLRSRRRHLC